jgi:hypothetical protein
LGPSDSGDTAPFAFEREVEDFEALTFEVTEPTRGEES